MLRTPSKEYVQNRLANMLKMYGNHHKALVEQMFSYGVPAKDIAIKLIRLNEIDKQLGNKSPTKGKREASGTTPSNPSVKRTTKKKRNKTTS